MTDAQSKAFDYLQDTSKQLITLATGFIALTVTFFDDVLNKPADAPKWLMFVSWSFFIASILAGILVALALTGHLGKNAAIPEESEQNSGNNLDIYVPNLRAFTALQIVGFVGGIIFAVVFALRTL